MELSEFRPHYKLAVDELCPWYNSAFSELRSRYNLEVVIILSFFLLFYRPDFTFVFHV